jgi:hypothetical protein
MRPLLFLLLITVCANAQQKSDREKEGIVGPVSSIQNYQAYFTYMNGIWGEGAKQYLNSDGFDRDGNRTGPGYLSLSHCFTNVDTKTSYDAKGYKTEIFSFTLKHNGEARGKRINIYNEKSNCLKVLR